MNFFNLNSICAPDHYISSVLHRLFILTEQPKGQQLKSSVNHLIDNLVHRADGSEWNSGEFYR